MAFLQLSVGTMVLWPFMDHGQFDNITALQWRYLILIGAVHTCFKYMLMYSAWQKIKNTDDRGDGVYLSRHCDPCGLFGLRAGLVADAKHRHWVDRHRRICSEHEPPLPLYPKKENPFA